MPRSFEVIVDTKEKQPWDLVSSEIIGKEYKALKTGDYTVKGLEDIICIERKGSISEIAQNLSQKRFKKELERMKPYRFKYLMIEGGLTELINYPLGSNLPQKIVSKIRVNGKYLLRCINRIQVKYGVHVVFGGNRENTEWIAINLMKEVVQLIYEENNSIPS